MKCRENLSPTGQATRTINMNEVGNKHWSLHQDWVSALSDARKVKCVYAKTRFSKIEILMSNNQWIEAATELRKLADECADLDSSNMSYPHSTEDREA
jgi:hypothetical protein